MVTAALPSVEPVTAEFRSKVAAVLEQFVDDKRHALSPLGADVRPLLSSARRAVGGGKRLRPAFAYWGWRAAGGPAAKDEDIIIASSAIELVHASALVHDDVMDDSATRRGEPAAHHLFTRERQNLDATVVHAERFGRSAAILLGDLLLSWSDELLSQSGFKRKDLARGRGYFDKLRTEVVAGQYLDVLAQTSSRSSAADAMRVVRYKSAKYTVERPLQFGAALHKDHPRLLAALSSYGIPLGEAFQLRDDILGVFGETTVTGKPTGDDIREGKRTLLVARAFDKADPTQHALLSRNVGDSNVDAAGIAAVQEVLQETGALADVETVIDELTSAALSALVHAPIVDDEARTALEVLTGRATQRVQ